MRPPLFLRSIAIAAVAIAILPSVATAADEGFPFGFEMTLNAAPMPGSKRVPTLDIEDNGNVAVELWCKGGDGQFSVAGNTVIFVPGTIQDRNCPADRARADDDFLAALSAATGWSRQGDLITFNGSKVLRFRLNTN